MPKKSDFQQPALSEDEIVAPKSNSSNNTILPTQIAQNANLSDIFPFEFEANKSPFLLSNAIINEQKAITAMYTEVIANANLNWETQELKISYQEQYIIVLATCNTFNKQSKKAPVFEFEKKKEIPLIKTYMALGLTSNWAEKTKQKFFEETREWKKICFHLWEPVFHQKKNMKLAFATSAKHDIKNDLDSQKEVENGTTHFILHVEILCNQTCQYALSISEKVRRGTPFNAVYNSALNKLYHYPYDAEMIFELAMALINRATQEDIHQMKEAEYIEYTMELAGFDYEDEVETYYQIAKCYALSIPLPDENNENEIEFGVSELVEKLPITPIYFLENQLSLQLKYFNNHGQEIKPEKAHEIDTGYNLRYSGKDTLVFQSKSLTKINLKIALKILPKAMVQIAFRSLLESKGINVRGEVIDAGYIRDITIILQNETDKPFSIEHAKKITQAIYLLLINISGLQSVNNREKLRKSERKMQGFGSTGQFTVLVNIALNAQNESHQILQLL
ncbi:hypothetical protein G9A89_016504 [Geosiphon pyriformis]|nr:hypothetical protein G9A89_016504 [Geosiphon pyriformis]